MRKKCFPYFAVEAPQPPCRLYRAPGPLQKIVQGGQGGFGVYPKKLVNFEQNHVWWKNQTKYFRYQISKTKISFERSQNSQLRGNFRLFYFAIFTYGDSDFPCLWWKGKDQVLNTIYLQIQTSLVMKYADNLSSETLKPSLPTIFSPNWDY